MFGHNEAPACKAKSASNISRRILSRMFFRFFIDRPIFATVMSVVITLAGGIAVFTLPITQYPEIAPPTVEVSTQYPGANAKVVADPIRCSADRATGQRRGEHALHVVAVHERRHVYANCHVRPGTDLNLAQVLVQNRVALAQPTLPDWCSVERHGEEEGAGRVDDCESVFAGWFARQSVSQQLRHDSDARRAVAS